LNPLLLCELRFFVSLHHVGVVRVIRGSLQMLQYRSLEL
jgi:hypothetical protein